MVMVAPGEPGAPVICWACAVAAPRSRSAVETTGAMGRAIHGWSVGMARTSAGEKLIPYLLDARRFLTHVKIAVNGSRNDTLGRHRMAGLRSIGPSRSPVSKVAMARALHDGLRARELYVGAKSLRHREVGRADQQEAELRLAQRLVELGV